MVNYAVFDKPRIPVGESDFKGETFDQPVKFSGTFEGKADFQGCTFEKYMNFAGATFLGEVDFSKAVFQQGVTFEKATFITNGADVSFREAVFLPFDISQNSDFTEEEKKAAIGINFVGTRFGKKYERVFDEWEIWFGKEEDNYTLQFRKKGSPPAKPEPTILFRNEGTLDTKLEGLPIWQFKSFICRQFFAISSANPGASANPGMVDLSGCRFGAINLNDISPDTAEAIAEKGEKSLTFILDDLAEDQLGLFKRHFLKNEPQTDETGKTTVMSILARHLGQVELAKAVNGPKMNISFAESEFCNLASTHFSSATFANAGNADFYGATFTNAGEAYFSRATFANAGDADFSGATFANAGNAYFSNATFANAGNAYFFNATFANAGNAYFWFATFANAGKADFSSAKFANAGGANFSHATFANAGNTNFWFATFANAGNADFSGATFANAGNANFYNATFSTEHETCFKEAFFLCEGEVNFSSVSILEKSAHIFQQCHFGGLQPTDDLSQPKVRFDNAVFPQITFEKGELKRVRDILRKSKREAAPGSEVTIREILGDMPPLPLKTEEYLKKLEEKGKEKEKEKGKDKIPLISPVFDKDIVVSWKGLSKESAENITFRLMNLQGSIFDGRTLSYVQLNSPTWREEKVGYFWKRDALYAEKLLSVWKRDDARHTEEFKKQLEDVKDQYIQLKNNLETQKNFLSAGDFHYGEMEIRKRLGGQGILDWCLIRLYRLFMGYGERPSWALIWLLFLVFVAVPSALSAPHYYKVCLSCWRTFGIKYFKTIVELITPFSWQKKDAVIDAASWWHYSVIVVGQLLLFIQLPLFILALRRRFKR